MTPGCDVGDFLEMVLKDFKLQVLITTVDYYIELSPLVRLRKNSMCKIWKGGGVVDLLVTSQCVAINRIFMCFGQFLRTMNTLLLHTMVMSSPHQEM